MGHESSLPKYSNSNAAEAELMANLSPRWEIKLLRTVKV